MSRSETNHPLASDSSRANGSGGNGHGRDDLLSTAEAAAVLGVKPATIYTYVTRGVLPAQRLDGDRSSWFRRTDVEGFKNRRHRRATPAPSPRSPASKITLIERGHYWYRGLDPAELASENSFEQVADFLWTGELVPDLDWGEWPDPDPWLLPPDADVSPLDRLRVASVHAAINDPLRYSTALPSVLIVARRAIRRLVAALPLLGAEPAGDSIVAQLWPRLTAATPSDADLRVLSGALIVMADHGMAPGTEVARTAASFRVDPHGIIDSGLAVLAGGWHGGRSYSAERLMAEIVATGDASAVVGDRLRHHGAVAALGQPRYATGDPRPGLVLDLLKAARAGHPVLEAYDQLLAVTTARGLPRPAAEIGLASVGAAYNFVPGSTEALFAIGRSAGWLAHAIEGYADAATESPSFRYTGARPDHALSKETQ